MSSQIAQAMGLYRDGESVARTGRRLGVDAHTVRRRLLERGGEAIALGVFGVAWLWPG